MTKRGKAVSLLFAAVVTVVVLASAAGPDWSLAPSPSPEPSANLTPTPTAPATKQYTVKQRKAWESTAWGVLGEMLVSTGAYSPHGRLDVRIVCKKHIKRARQLLIEHGVPEDAVIIKAGGPIDVDAYPDLFPCYPPEVEDPTTGISSPGFGGIYTDSGSIYIYLLEPSLENAARLLNEVHGYFPLEKVRVLQGRYTWEQLMAWYHLYLNSPMPEGPWRYGMIELNAMLNPRYNRLYMVGNETEHTPDVEQMENRLLRLGIPRDAVILYGDEIEAPPTPEVVPPSHTPSSALDSPTHFAEPVPVPTMTRGLWRAKVEFALDEASLDGSLVESLVTKLNTRAPSGFDHVSYLYDERRVRF